MLVSARERGFLTPCVVGRGSETSDRRPQCSHGRRTWDPTRPGPVGVRASPGARDSLVRSAPSRGTACGRRKCHLRTTNPVPLGGWRYQCRAGAGPLTRTLALQTVQDGRQFLKYVDPRLGVPLPERDYGGNCLIYDADNETDPFHNVWVRTPGGRGQDAVGGGPHWRGTLCPWVRVCPHTPQHVCETPDRPLAGAVQGALGVHRGGRPRAVRTSQDPGRAVGAAQGGGGGRGGV